jgi:hypothetical protein
VTPTATDQPALLLPIEQTALRSLIVSVVAETLDRYHASHHTMGDALAYDEAEAAAMLKMSPHQLRDERLRGRVRAFVIVGRRVRYRREDLLQYLVRNPAKSESQRA